MTVIAVAVFILLAVNLFVIDRLQDAVFRAIRSSDEALYRKIMGEAHFSWLDRPGFYNPANDTPIAWRLNREIFLRQEPTIKQLVSERRRGIYLFLVSVELIGFLAFLVLVTLS